MKVKQQHIESLKEREYLWNVFCKEYSKRDVREKAYSDIAVILEKQVKINGLRAQLGREINKETKTKSEQSSHKQCHSS